MSTRTSRKNAVRDRHESWSPVQRALRQLVRERHGDDFAEAALQWSAGARALSVKTLYSWFAARRVVPRRPRLDVVAEREGLDAARLRRGELHSVARRHIDPNMARAMGEWAVRSENPTTRRQAYMARELYINGERASTWGQDQKTTITGVDMVPGTRNMMLYVFAPDANAKGGVSLELRPVAPSEAHAISDELVNMFKGRYPENLPAELLTSVGKATK